MGGGINDNYTLCRIPAYSFPDTDAVAEEPPSLGCLLHTIQKEFSVLLPIVQPSA